MFSVFFEDLAALFEKGGVVMYPLAVCSFVAIYVCLTKILALRRGILLDGQALVSWRSWLHSWNQGEFSRERLELTLLHQIMEPLFPLLPLNEKLLREKIRERFAQIQIKLNRNLHLLEIITGISPLLGLLGTAMGMLKVFSRLSEENIAVGFLSVGISEALITTIVGLMIAVPSLIAHSLFSKKIEHILSQLEIQINELLFEFREKLTGQA